MQRVRIPWACWYGNEDHTIWFPRGWNVSVAHMRDAPGMDFSAVEEALDKPLGTPRLQELARGARTVAIAVDDVSRPTPAHVVLPLMIRRLEEVGVLRDDVCVLLSLGAHRPMTRFDMIKKLGNEVVTTVQVFNHTPFDDLVSLGESRVGHPIAINRRFIQADLRIVLGCVLPHPSAGFGGGAKIVIPGVAGIETLASNHSPGFYEKDGEKFAHRCVGEPNNPLRADMEDIARRVGVGYSVNVVVNSRLGIAGLFVGDLVEAHREACRLAREVYATKLVQDPDVVVLNAYPKDTDFVQICNAFNVAESAHGRLLRRRPGVDRTIVVTSACSEGAGYHGLEGPGLRLFTPRDRTLPPEALGGVETWVYSPNVSRAEIRQFFNGPPRPLYNEWAGVLEELTRRHGGSPTVAVYPLASIQMAGL